MSLFEFILVMVSFVLAIGVTHLLQGSVKIFRHRPTLGLDWVPLAWAASLFFTSMTYWWSLWDFRLVEWTYLSFFFVLLAPTSLFTAISLLLSDDATPSDPSGSSNFEGVRVPFMVVMLLYVIVWSADGWVLGVEPLWNSLRVPQIFVGGLFLVGAIASRRTAKFVAAAYLVLSAVGGFATRFQPGSFGPS